MKVLLEGREQAGWSIEARCTGVGNGAGGCEALLLVEEGDIFETRSHARDETVGYATFRCSECLVLTDLDPKPPRRVWAGKVDPAKGSGGPNVGDEGVRDPENPCAGFAPGEPSPGQGCQGDGHYLCQECVCLEVPAHNPHTPPDEAP